MTAKIRATYYYKINHMNLLITHSETVNWLKLFWFHEDDYNIIGNFKEII